MEIISYLSENDSRKILEESKVSFLDPETNEPPEPIRIVDITNLCPENKEGVDLGKYKLLIFVKRSTDNKLFVIIKTARSYNYSFPLDDLTEMDHCCFYLNIREEELINIIKRHSSDLKAE